jgi:hypothetical protein
MGAALRDRRSPYRPFGPPLTGGHDYAESRIHPPVSGHDRSPGMQSADLWKGPSGPV